MDKKKKKQRRKLTLPIRINVLFFIVFLLFITLIVRLGTLQIVEGEDFASELQRTNEVVVYKPVPRGKIYDRNGKLIVDNEPMYAITYTRAQGTKAEELLETAEKLAQFIRMDTKKIREMDKKDYWMLKNPKKAYNLITEDELKKVSEGELSNADTRKLQLERIPASAINGFSKAEMNVIAILRTIINSSDLTPQIVKKTGVTLKEYAEVSEHLSELPGVDTTIDWERKYLYDSTLKSVLGKVTTYEEGLPEERLDYFLSRGYNRNDRVGKSYLEMQYEDLLHGQKQRVVNTLDKSGKVISSEVVNEGQRGKDLVLTIDIELQKKVEKIITNEIRPYIGVGHGKYLDRAFVVVTNPKTGEILAMSGKYFERVDGKLQESDMALGTITTSYNMGSAVKGATVLTGYSTKAISMGQTFLDEQLRIKGTPTKGSYQNLGWVNDLEAIKRSSNVFMFKTAIAIGKGSYVPNAPLKINKDAFQIMRNHFGQLGLGVRTGLDLPGEQVGLTGSTDVSGKILDLGIGQFDTYTPMQLAQYVSTIANDGYRMQFHLLKEVHEPVNSEGLGPLLSEVQPKVLNKIQNSDTEIERVKQGFRLVTSAAGGTATRYFGGAAYRPAGKTGTAQAFYDGPKWDKKTQQPATQNVTFVSYAPYDNPEVAIAVVVPWVSSTGSNGLHINFPIAQKVYKAYFDLKAGKQDKDKKEQNSPENNTGE